MGHSAPSVHSATVAHDQSLAAPQTSDCDPALPKGGEGAISGEVFPADWHPDAIEPDQKYKTRSDLILLQKLIDSPYEFPPGMFNQMTRELYHMAMGLSSDGTEHIRVGKRTKIRAAQVLDKLHSKNLALATALLGKQHLHIHADADDPITDEDRRLASLAALDAEIAKREFCAGRGTADFDEGAKPVQ